MQSKIPSNLLTSMIKSELQYTSTGVNNLEVMT